MKIWVLYRPSYPEVGKIKVEEVGLFVFMK
jgi:hypothetical protein